MKSSEDTNIIQSFQVNDIYTIVEYTAGEELMRKLQTLSICSRRGTRYIEGINFDQNPEALLIETSHLKTC